MDAISRSNQLSKAFALAAFFAASNAFADLAGVLAIAQAAGAVAGPIAKPIADVQKAKIEAETDEKLNAMANETSLGLQAIQSNTLIVDTAMKAAMQANTNATTERIQAITERGKTDRERMILEAQERQSIRDINFQSYKFDVQMQQQLDNFRLETERMQQAERAALARLDALRTAAGVSTGFTDNNGVLGSSSSGIAGVDGATPAQSRTGKRRPLVTVARASALRDSGTRYAGVPHARSARTGTRSSYTNAPLTPSRTH